MTALQLNNNIYRSLGIISEDENVLRKAAKYLSRLAKSMTDDPTRLSKEEFFANVDEAVEQAKQGRTHRMRDDESLEDFLRRVG